MISRIPEWVARDAIEFCQAYARHLEGAPNAMCGMAKIAIGVAQNADQTVEADPSDLKLLDELLLDYMRHLKLQPADMATHSLTTLQAMKRLRDAWHDGEMKEITLTWANHFKEVPL